MHILLHLWLFPLAPAGGPVALPETTSSRNIERRRRFLYGGNSPGNARLFSPISKGRACMGAPLFE
jgi:hypothetical protein